MIEKGSNPALDDEKDIDIAGVFHKYLQHWKMFVIALIVCIAGGIVYLIFTAPEYGVSAKILIKEEDKSSKLDLMSAFSDMGGGMSSKNIDNETEVLKSRSLMMLVSDSLNLRVSYYAKNKIPKLDLYHSAPIVVKYTGFDTYQYIFFDIDYDKAADLLIVKNKDLGLDVNVKWGESVKTVYGSFVIDKNPLAAEVYPLEVAFTPIQVIPLIGIDATSKYSSVLELSLKEANKQKAVDIINALIYYYNRESLLDKNKVAQNTIDFINSRLGFISSELDSVEKGVEEYKKTHQMTDLKADGTIYLKTNSEYDAKISEAELQLNVIRSIKSYLESKKNKDNIVPSNLGVMDPTLVALIEAFNKAQLEKLRVVQGMKPGNPVLADYEHQTDVMRKGLVENIKNIEKGAELAKNSLERQGDLFSSKISSLPTKEREYKEQARQQKIKETLYTYLLQKREENTLLLQSAVPGAKIIDETFVDPKPVSPRKSIVLSLAFILGVLIPILILYLKEALSYKLVSKEELQNLTHIPLLGQIPIRKDQSILGGGESGSILSEQFRLNAANIDFMLPKKGCKKVMITSTVSGEGKTFYATNLAISLANIGKKVLLINLDIHKSDDAYLFQPDTKKGVTSYLSDSDEQLDDIIVKPKLYANLSVLPAGYIPPNPGLLLMSPRLSELFVSVEAEFDFIIIDTPPVGLLADAMAINKYADATIYIVRAKYTPKSVLKNLDVLQASNQLTNMNLVLNGGEMKGNYGKYYNKYYQK